MSKEPAMTDLLTASATDSAPSLSPARREVLLIANPTSGQRRAARAIGAVVQELADIGHVHVIKTTRGGEAYEIARDMLRRTDLALELVAVIGGDGTINEVARGVLAADRTDVPLGLVPYGTGNVIAKQFRIPRHRPRAASAIIGRGHVRELDIVHIRAGEDSTVDRAEHLHAKGVMLGVAGMGFDAAVVREFHRSRKRWAPGFGYYSWLTLKLVVAYRNPYISVVIDGVPMDVPARWVIVANTASYGGPIRFAPTAKPDDGVLDVVAFTVSPTTHALRIFPTLALGDATKLPCVKHWRATQSVELRPCHRDDQPPAKWVDQFPCQVDGDPAGFAPVTFTLDPTRRFRILAPR